MQPYMLVIISNDVIGWESFVILCTVCMCVCVLCVCVCRVCVLW